MKKKLNHFINIQCLKQKQDILKTNISNIIFCKNIGFKYKNNDNIYHYKAMGTKQFKQAINQLYYSNRDDYVKNTKATFSLPLISDLKKVVSIVEFDLLGKIVGEYKFK